MAWQLELKRPQPEGEGSHPAGAEASGVSSEIGSHAGAPSADAMGEPKAAERKQETLAERRKRMAGLREEREAERYRKELLEKQARKQRSKEQGGATGGDGGDTSGERVQNATEGRAPADGGTKVEELEEVD